MMQPPKTRTLCAVACGTLLAFAAGTAIAEDYPTRPVRIIVGFPPGGATDLVARILAPKLGDALKQQVVIANRAGANGTIGAELAANASPDGYSLHLGTLGALVKNSGLDSMLDAVISVDPLRVFKPDMRVYQLAVNQLGVGKERIGFVSSNCWDAIAAKHFGFTVFWINRLNAPADLHGAAPDFTIHSLNEIAPLL